MMYSFIAFLVGAIWSYYLQNIYKKPNNIEILKNALLTLSLLKLKKDDISNNFDFNYENYDGTKLPPLSGSDLNCACFSYIKDIRNDVFYTSIMESKQIAINKYLEKNFKSEQQIIDFFNEVVERVK